LQRVEGRALHASDLLSETALTGVLDEQLIAVDAYGEQEVERVLRSRRGRCAVITTGGSVRSYDVSAASAAP
jgi:ABC-type Mn2+/Zn2+ transport system ATPase subunit